MSSRRPTSPPGLVPARPKAVDQAANRLREAILAGEIPAGRDLPGERELSERLSVSRLTLRSALARLEAEGLVRPMHGSGTRVLDFRESGGVDLLGYLARQAFEGGTIPLEILADLLELRRMMAVEALELVAVRATAGEIAALRAHLEELTLAVDDPRRFMDADLAFARLIVRATHNFALELLYNTIRRVLAEHDAFAPVFVANARQTVLAYARLLGFIEKGDPSRVRRVARRLLERLDRHTLDRIRSFVPETSTEEVAR